MTNADDVEIFSIGSKVLSIDFGEGLISAIEKLQADGDDFYVVQYGKANSKNYFPTKNNKKIRQVSSESEFKAILKILQNKRVPMKIDSRKERQAYFDRSLERNNIEKIVIRICELLSIGDLIPREQKIIDRLVETLELENSIIFSISAKESKEAISKLLA